MAALTDFGMPLLDATTSIMPLVANFSCHGADQNAERQHHDKH